MPSIKTYSVVQISTPLIGDKLELIQTLIPIPGSLFAATFATGEDAELFIEANLPTGAYFIVSTINKL